jgi:DNA mismatch repair protein MLH3
MSILPLPHDVRTQVKSSVEITSLTDVVEELFKNALDADACNVHVTIDFGKGFCTVKDDGTGIPSSEFSSSGNLARLHRE